MGAGLSRRLAPLGELAEVTPGATAGPARLYKLPGFAGELGFISPMSEHHCNSCNRLRLTAQGRLRPCLLVGAEVDVKEALRQGGSDQELASLFQEAMQRKAQQLSSFLGNQDYPSRSMAVIGG